MGKGDKGKDPPDEEELVTVTVRMPADLVDKIDALAKEEDRSRAAQVREIVKKGIAEETEQAPAGR